MPTALTSRGLSTAAYRSTIGATTAGSIAHVGQRALYNFSLTEAKQLLFDGLAPSNANPDLYWTLTGPRGVEISSRRFYGSESYELGGTNPLLDLIGGDYVLSFDLGGDATGDFSFRLLDIGVAPVIASETVVSGQLNPVNETDVYRFDVVAGKRYYVDRQLLNSSSDWQTWRLFDSYGRQLLGPQNLDDIDIFTPTQSGRYTLVVEGRIWQSQYRATTDYSFKLLEISDDLATIVPGQSFGLETPRTAGKIGGAVRLDGVHYGEIADNDAIDLTGSLTLEAWFRVDGYASEWQALFYKGNGNYWQRTYTLWVNSAGYLHLSTGDNNNQTISTTAGSVKLGEWQHVAAVLDRTTGAMKLYLDGVEAATGDLRSAPAIASDQPLFIGRSLEGNPLFQGAVDDVRLWNTVRTPEQIAGGRDAALAGTEAGLVFYLPADETSGETLADATGNGHPATLHHIYGAASGVVAGFLDFGQRDVYRFTLGAAERLYFDSLADRYDLRWSLIGPRGTVVSGRPFQQSDSADGSSILDLAAGDYTLTVDANVGSSGAYAFRLLDLADAQPLALDTQVDGTLDPANSTVAYRFDATAGERYYFDRSANGNTYWRLLDPFGRAVFGPGYLGSEMPDVTALAFSGTYTLLIEGRRDAGGSSPYGFKVQRIVDPTVAITPGEASGRTPRWRSGQFGSALALDGLASLEVAPNSALDLRQTATFEAWVNIDRFANTWTPLFYRGNGDPQQRSYSVWLNGNGSVLISSADGGEQGVITAPGLITTGVWHHIAAVMDRPNGQMRILVDGVERALGGVRQTPASAATGPLRIGNSSEFAGDYAGIVGRVDELRVWNVARSNEQIVASKDATLAGSEAGLVVLLKADEGSGTVLADSSGKGNAATLVESTPGIVSGAIARAGERVGYSFTLAQPATRLYFDSLTNNGSLRWSLAGPRGIVTAGRSFQYGDSVDGSAFFELAAGNYTLTVDGVDDTVAPFAFRLLPLDAATPLSVGTQVDAQLTPANETDAYGFDVAVAGQRFYFDTISRLGGDIYWRLLDPFGRPVEGPSSMNSSGEDREFTLPFAGRYTLLIEGRFYVGGNAAYSFNLQPIVDEQAALTLGTTTAGSIAHVGQRDIYSFTLAAGAPVYFDSLTHNSRLNWTLAGPRGTVVTGRSFSNSDSLDFGASPVLDLVAGDYTLTIDGSGDATGDYGFRLLDLSSAPSLALGTSVSGSLSPGNATVAYRLDGTARDRVGFELISESRNSAGWRLLDPYLSPVFGPSNVESVSAVTLPYDRHELPAGRRPRRRRHAGRLQLPRSRPQPAGKRPDCAEFRRGRPAIRARDFQRCAAFGAAGWTVGQFPAVVAGRCHRHQHGRFQQHRGRCRSGNGDGRFRSAHHPGQQPGRRHRLRVARPESLGQQRPCGAVRRRAEPRGQLRRRLRPGQQRRDQRQPRIAAFQRQQAR